MKKLPILIAVAAMALTAIQSQAGTILWDGSSAVGSFSTPEDFSSGGSLSLYGNGSGAPPIFSNSVSPSGGNNYGAVVPVNLHTGFAFSLTLVDPSAQLQFDSFSFESRSTTTGPATLTLYVSNTNDFNSATALFSSASPTNSSYATYGTSSALFTSSGDTLYFWIDGFRTGGSTSSSANWRADNINLGYTVVSVPEPSTYALLAIGLGGILFFRRRSKSVSQKTLS